MRRRREQIPAIRGRARASIILPDGSKRLITRWTKNLVLREATTIWAHLLMSADAKYRISTMYIEYVNVASPGDTAPNPAYDRNPGSGVDYYSGLSLSSDRDYLRVPLVPRLSSTDTELYPGGNLITWSAQTRGSEGVHGKEFSPDVNSLVVGGALVAVLSESDPTQDLVMSRFYFAEADQPAKPTVGQVGIDWESELQ